MEQIVDIPSSGGGFGQESSSSAGPADEDFTGEKCAVGSTLESEGARHCQPIYAGDSDPEVRIGLWRLTDSHGSFS